MNETADNSLLTVANPFSDLSGEMPVRKTVWRATATPPVEPAVRPQPVPEIAAIRQADASLVDEQERGGRTDPIGLLRTARECLDVFLIAPDNLELAETALDLLDRHVALYGDVYGNVARARAGVSALLPAPPVRDAAFDESDVARDDKGQFAEGGSKEGDSKDSKGYDRDTYAAMSVPDRKAAFGKLSDEERDRQADAPNSVTKRIDDLMRDSGVPDRPTEGSPSQNAEARVAQMLEVGVLTEGAAERVMEQGALVADGLTALGVDAALASKMALDTIDATAAQELETMGRTLGDHGARHLEGDTRMALDALGSMGLDTPENQVLMALAGSFHDAGYMTEPSREFLDEDHPRWSQQYYDANVRADVEKALGPEAADALSRIIATHADTTMDWEEDPLASAFRLGDNLALFHEEKLPALFDYVPGNTRELIDYARGQSLEDTQAAMRANIERAQGLSDEQRERLNAAVDEVNPILPKLTIGMVGARVGDIEWTGEHMTVDLIRTPANEALSQVLDMGQRQFDKFAKTYGVDPKEFSETGAAEFRDADGNLLLAAEIIKAEARMVEVLVRRGVDVDEAFRIARRARLAGRLDLDLQEYD